MDSLAIVGDVHGDARRLEGLLRHPKIRGRRLVFVGDLVNRGPDSRSVLEMAVSLRATGSAVFLCGNHDLAFLRYWETGDFVPFAMVGGISTIKSYVGVAHGNLHRQFRSAVPGRHVALLRACDTHFSSDGLLVAHAGVPPQRPATRARIPLAHGPFNALFDGAWEGPDLLVCGHYVQRSGKPFERGQFICVDTGCGTTGGPLTALLLPERRFVRAG